MRLRSRLAVYCARLVYAAVTGLGGGSGSALPGRIARKINPEILSVLSRMVRKKVIAVTGTNGKTTTNNILAHALEAQGQKVISNRMGANLQDGVITAFALALGQGGRQDADYACIEVDELSSKTIFSRLKPDCVIITNIFRDQLDRSGEVDTVCEKIRDAIGQAPEAELIVNGDDVCSWVLTSGVKNPVTFYGIDEKLADGLPVGTREIVFCPACGARLEYAFFQYGQLGGWHCPDCGLRRPCPDMAVTDIVFRDGAYSYVLDGMCVESGTGAPYHLYNTLAAYTALWALDAPRGDFRRTVERFDFGNGRESVFTINGASVQLHLAKNPIGLQQKLFLIERDPRPKDVLIQINDTKLDGEDISWLWDVDYRYLANSGVKKVVTGGMRGDDMELCLKYEEISSHATENICRAIRELTQRGSKNLYVITNYSGLYKTNRMLRELQAAGEERACS